MKILKLNLIVTTLIFSTIFAQAQNSIEKTLVKSFNLKGATEIIIDLEGNIDVQERKSDILRVQMTIAIGGTEAMLKSLVTGGRYNLNLAKTDNGSVITAPQMNRDVTVRGKKLTETISYLVYAPENVTVKYGGETASDISTGTPGGAL